MSVQLAGPIRPHDGRSVIGRVLDRVRSWLAGGGSLQSPLMPAGMLNSFWIGPDGGGFGDEGPRVTEASVLGVPAFGRGVDLISSTIAGVELRAYRFDREQMIDVRLEPGPELLRDPSPLGTPWDWRYGVVNDLILFGNSFARLGEPNAEGWPRWLVPVPADLVELGQDRDTGALVWRVNGDLVPFGELFHISAGNRSGYVLGRSVITQYRDTLAGVLATDRHGRKYFTAGGMPSAIIQSNDPDFSQVQADAVKKRYRDTIGSGSREPLVLSPNYTFTPVVSDAEKQQLVEARKWDATTAAMILGMPPSYLGLEGPSMTYTTVESVDIGFVRDTVDRWAKPIEHAVTKWLLPTGQQARFDWSGRMRFDSKTRAETLKVEIDAGLLDVDEGRRMLDRPPLPKKPVPKQLEPFTGDDDQDQDTDGTGEAPGTVGGEITPTPEVAR